MSQIKLPTTPEEYAAALAEAEKKGANDAQKIISALEDKVNLIEGNPMEFPRLIDDKKIVWELQALNPIHIFGVEYNYEHFTDDEAAQAKFEMSAADVLKDVFKKKPHLFIKKK